LSSDPVQVHGVEVGWPNVSAAIGEIRVRATAAPDPARPVFIGIAPSDAATRYLAGAEQMTVTDLADGRRGTTTHPGAGVTTRPPDVGIWVAQTSGPGTQSLTWPVADGGGGRSS
jgi:hypothetical protein